MVERQAVISKCGRFRYSLYRKWSEGPEIAWVMLNPSTADGEQDDPTIRRCMSFSKRDGFGSMLVANLFAYRATDPKKLLGLADPYGPLNGATLAGLSGTVVAAWGATQRPHVPQSWLDKRAWVCLGTTKDGHPRHPLYVRADQPFVPWLPVSERQLPPTKETT